MKTKLIRIGNSQGIRIPKPLIEESGISEEIEMTLRNNEIILRPADVKRKNWEESFAQMAGNKDDMLLDPEETDTSSEWDDTEWTW